MKYNHLLVSQMSKPLTKEENDVLFSRIVAGDNRARDEMIVGNMALVISKVNMFIKKHPYVSNLRDDLTSAGFVGLTVSVQKLTSNVEKLLAYIGSTIDNHLRDLLEAEMSIRIPQESERIARKMGEPIEQCFVYRIKDDVFTRVNTDFEMKDLIDSCCETENEREFVRLRTQGYTLAEISIKTGVPLGSMTYLINKLTKKIGQKLQL